MRTLNNNILVKELQNNGDVTPEGVILPETLKLGYEIGVVITVSEPVYSDDPGATYKPMVQAGNLVAYHANSGVPVMIGGEACRFVMEGNILAVLEENVIEEAPPKLAH